MSFAVPGALMMLGLALPVILFYILKVRLRRLNVSTNLFWKQIYDKKPPRSIWQYLRHLISLLLQLLLLVLLVFSVADPYFPWQLLQARRIVAVIDNSASMQANDVEPSRFEAAIDSAAKLVEGLRFRDQMAIVLSGPTPEVVLGMTSHVPTLKRTLREISVSDNPTHLNNAVDLGKKLIGEHPRGQVVVFTDGCYDEFGKATAGELAVDPLASAEEENSISSVEADASPLNSTNNGSEQQSDTGAAVSTGEVPVDFRIFGTRAANIGITQFQVRRSLIDPVGYQVLAAVQNASDDPVDCRLEIELDGAPVDVVPLSLEPNELWSRSIEKTSLEGGTLVGRLTTVEAAESSGGSSERTATTAQSEGPESVNYLACDDVAQAILPGREIQSVLIVTKGNLFLRKVFEANPLVKVSVAAEFPEAWPAETIIVFDRELPEKLPGNDVFVVDPVASCDLWELGEPLRDPIVTDQDKDSPLMKHVRLDNVLMPEARKITINSKSRTLAGALSKDPVYAEIERDSGGKCLVLTVNLEKSDLAFRTAFPIMATNALGWLAGTSGELREATSTGHTVSFQPDAQLTTEKLKLTSPDGTSTTIARSSDEASIGRELTGQALTDPDELTLGPFDKSGIWVIHAAEENDATQPESAQPPEDESAVRLASFAVNIANQRETDLRPPEPLLANEEVQPLAAGLFARPVWFYLVAAGCVLSVVEWFLYQRRVIS